MHDSSYIDVRLSILSTGSRGKAAVSTEDATQIRVERNGTEVRDSHVSGQTIAMKIKPPLHIERWVYPN